MRINLTNSLCFWRGRILVRLSPTILEVGTYLTLIFPSLTSCLNQ